MDFIQKWMELEKRMYHLMEAKKKSPSSNLEVIWQELYEKEQDLIRTLPITKLIDIYYELIQKNDLPQNFIFFHNVLEKKVDPVLLRMYYLLERRIRFLSFQEISTIEYHTMERIVGNSYFQKIMKQGDTIDAFEYELSEYFQTIEPIDNFYILEDDIAFKKIEDIDFLIDILKKEMYCFTYDYLFSKAKQRKTWENYMNSILKIVPEEHHFTLLEEIKNSCFSIQEEARVSYQKVKALNDYLSSKDKNISLWETEPVLKISEVEEAEEPEDVFIADEETIIEYEIAFQELQSVSRKMLNVLEQMIEKKNKVSLANYYALKKEESDILASIKDIIEFQDYLGLCYEDKNLYPIPYRILNYTKSLMNKEDKNSYENIEEFLKLRVFYRVYHYGLEQEQQPEDFYVEVPWEILGEDMIDQMDYILKYLFGYCTKEELEENFEDFTFFCEQEKNMEQEKELKQVFDGIIHKFLLKLGELVKKEQDKEKKKFYQMSFYYLLFLEGGLLDIYMENSLNVYVNKVEIPNLKEEYYEDYKEYMLEELKTLKTYQTEEEKQAYLLYKESVLETLRKSDQVSLRKKRNP